jgi:AcrR family transcriptional regulator
METQRRRKPAKLTELVVRPKASIRKSRSAVAEHTARKPLQDRSMQRFERIIAATEQFLNTANLEDISFYDIARQADISPASVNYLFPTMAALRTELMKRYSQQHAEAILAHHQVIARMRNLTWQDWMRLLSKRAQQEFNGNRAMSEVVLGPVLHRESRRAQLDLNVRLAHATIEQFNKTFVLPSIPDLEQRFVMLYDMIDGLWSAAYVRHGWIDDDTVEESMRIQIAYLRTILPEVLPLARRQR